MAPSQHPWADFFEHISLPIRARLNGIQIYHGTFQVLPLVPAAPINLVTIHDMAVFAFPQAYSSKFALYMRFLIGRAIHQADRVIAVSHETRREIIRFIPAAEHKNVVILNGVGSEFIEARKIPPHALNELKSRLNISEPYILFVGNLEPKKNLVRLIAAFEKLKKSGAIGETLVIVGDKPPKLPDCGIDEQDALNKGYIRFTGYLPDHDLPTLYRGASVVAYPSLYEGFGMPVLEAMACGIPVVTSNCSSLPEVAGGAAMLVDPLDVDDIASGLHKSLHDHEWRSESTESGIKRANELSWQANAEKFVDLYCEYLK